MVNDSARPAYGTPDNEGPLTWEKEQNQEFKQKFILFTKRFAIGFLIMLVISLAFHYSDTDMGKSFGPEDYSISIESSLIFFWIILFTLYLSHLVPILLLMFINKFIVQIKETRGDVEEPEPVQEEEPQATDEEITTAMEAAGQDPEDVDDD